MLDGGFGAVLQNVEKVLKAERKEIYTYNHKKYKDIVLFSFVINNFLQMVKKKFFIFTFKYHVISDTTATSIILGGSLVQNS